MDAEAFENFLSSMQDYLGQASLIFTVKDGKVILGTDEDAPAPAELFTGLTPFYTLFQDADPELSDETVVLNERLERLSALIRKAYDRHHIHYTITSPYGTVNAVIQEGNHLYHYYYERGQIEWLDADLTAPDPFVISRVEHPEWGGYEIHSADHPGEDLTMEREETADGVSRRWPDAVYGERYIVEYNNGSRVLFGVIQREGSRLVNEILEAYNKRFGTAYGYLGDENGPDVHFYGKYDGFYALKLTGIRRR